MFTLWSLVSSALGAAIGGPLGGLLGDSIGWRWYVPAIRLHRESLLTKTHILSLVGLSLFKSQSVSFTSPSSLGKSIFLLDRAPSRIS